MSPSGPGCAKTCLSQGCAELLSQFPSLDKAGKCNWFSHRQNREGISIRKLNVRVFTQTGSKAEVLAPQSDFSFGSNSGHCSTGPTNWKAASTIPPNSGPAKHADGTVPSGDLPDGQFFDPGVQSPLQKYSASRLTQIKSISTVVPSLSEGRFAIVTNVGRDAVDADAPMTNGV